MINPWDKIFDSDFESAYKLANENYLKTSQDFDLRARAICSLLLQKYNDALEDFLILNDNEKKTDRVSDGTYMDIGLCYYAIGNIDKAIDYFKFPVTNRKEIKYTSDISIPASILFYVAIKLNQADILKIATKELKRLNQIVPLYLLGQISAVELNKMYEDETDEILINRKKCKVEFYKAAKDLASGHFEKYTQHINYCVDLKGTYLEFEYYFARIEQGRLNSR